MGEKITKMDRQPIISAKDVEITFSLRGKKLNAIRKCSLDLYDGETLAIDFVAEPPFYQVSETHAAKTWYLDPRAPKMERPHSIQNLREKMGKMGGSNLNG